MIVILVITYFTTTNPEQDNSRPSIAKKLTQENPNDKIVIVKDADYNTLKKVLVEFCNMYNKEKFQAQPRLYKLSETEFAITFPYDINFEIYCYFINYIPNPKDIQWQPNVIAWATTKPADIWVTENTSNKKVMLFILEDDNEHDNVYLTSKDNFGYKLGFAVGEEKQLLDILKKKYIAPTIALIV